MLTVLVIVSVFALVFLITAVFLGTEMLKKFHFMRDFVNHSNQLVTWNYAGDRKPGMYKIVLSGQKPFGALVGFRLEIPAIGFSGYDYYGFVRSDMGGLAVISTYLGKGKCEFRFLTTSDKSQITVTSTEGDQELMPQEVYPPHWYQKLGFYG